MALQTESGRTVQYETDEEESESGNASNETDDTQSGSRCPTDKSKWITLAFTISSMTFSLVASLAFTNRWFTVTSRGIFICCMALFNILVRLLQYFVAQKKFKETKKEQVKVVRNVNEYANVRTAQAEFAKAYDVTVNANQNKYATMFIGISTFNDSIFDALQGIDMSVYDVRSLFRDVTLF